MERKFCEYARKSLAERRYNLIATAELEKDMYKMTNDEVLRLVADCAFDSAAEIQKFVTIIDQYYKDYELEVFGESLGKTLVLGDPAELSKNKIKSINRYLTRYEVYNIVDAVERYAHKWMILGAFEGIGTHGEPWKDLFETDASGINIKEGTITLNSGKTFKYSEKLIHIAVQASQEDFFYNSRHYKQMTADTGKILRPALRGTHPGVVSYASAQNMFQKIRAGMGNEYIGGQRLQMSGFYEAISERLGGKAYRPEMRTEIMDILEKYNKTDLTDKSIKDLRWTVRMVY